MFIYKITNIKNNKVYIGLTIRPVEERWRRHLNDALNNVIDTHFARAIRYYGPLNFTVEVIDTASNQKELTAKEQYWISWYDSVKTGYNETDATYKCGGNTYQGKTDEEMKQIKEKLHESKLGKKNPNAKKVKCRNVITKEEYHFDTQKQMLDFFKETNHQFCSRRCLGRIKCLYKGEWQIAFEENEYPE